MDRQFDSVLSAASADTVRREARFSPNPGFGAPVRLRGPVLADYPIEVQWYDASGRGLGTSTLDDPGAAVTPPRVVGLLVYRLAGRGGYAARGRWLQLE